MNKVIRIFIAFMWKFDNFLYICTSETIPNFTELILFSFTKNKSIILFSERLRKILLDIYNFWDTYILPKFVGK